MTNIVFHTATMARLYAQQGHFRKAAEIYRHILSKEPDRQDIVVELAAIEKKLPDMEPESDADNDMKETDLVYLFHKWFQMAASRGRLVRLEKLKQQFSTQK